MKKKVSPKRKSSPKKKSAATYDLIIRCGYLLPMQGGKAKLFLDQCIGIQGSRIARIEKWKGPYKAKKFLDASDKVVMPGLINAHTHLPMSLFRGLADDLPLEEWLFKHILPLEARVVSPEFVRLGTELSLLEGLLAGTTTYCDMFYYEDEIADVVDKFGLRALLGESLADFPRPDDKKNDGNWMRILERMIKKYRDHERIEVSVACHAPYSCSDATFKKGLSFAQKHNLRMQVHVAETKVEFDSSMKEHKLSPVERLKHLGYLDHPSLFAHCVHLTDADIEMLAHSKVGVAHNPECNMKLGSGTAPIAQMLRSGIRVGLGTDGPASNNNLNLFNEMDTAAKLQKLANSNTSAMTAEDALNMATLGGAQAIGMGEKIGSLEVGKYADIIFVSLDAPHMQPMHDFAAQLVYATNGSEVDTVICHGRILLEKRKPKLFKVEDLYARIHRYRKKMSF